MKSHPNHHAEPVQELSFFTTGDGCRIAYRLDGSPGQPVLVLSNSIGTTMHMWDLQIEALSKHFRVLRFDTRGHGASDVPVGAYSMDRLGRDVIELLDALHIDRVYFCGLSLGGMIGQWLGIYTPERIEALILCNTSAYLGPASQFDERIHDVLHVKSIAETADMFLSYWFPAQMLNVKNPSVDAVRAMLLAMQPQGFAGGYAAVRDMDMRRTVALIRHPTLVIGGLHDTVTLPSHSEWIAAQIPGAKLTMLPAVHLSNIEHPEAFLDAVLEFLHQPTRLAAHA